ncbi:hypothetical protein EDC04DRAFT_2603206 [Pisolithus marmoratus]|nr:hypothetical protein EDC04DRAFT_2603206 [Pisolithus marmoratus]
MLAKMSPFTTNCLAVEKLVQLEQEVLSPSEIAILLDRFKDYPPHAVTYIILAENASVEIREAWLRRRIAETTSTRFWQNDGLRLSEDKNRGKLHSFPTTRGVLLPYYPPSLLRAESAQLRRTAVKETLLLLAISFEADRTTRRYNQDKQNPSTTDAMGDATRRVEVKELVQLESDILTPSETVTVLDCFQKDSTLAETYMILVKKASPEIRVAWLRRRLLGPTNWDLT